METGTETKKHIRKQVLSQRDALSQKERMAKSRLIAEKLMEMPVYKRTQQILLYASFRSEVDTSALMKQALADGKKVYCPLVRGCDMVFYRIWGETDLQAGYQGIMEPAAQEENRYCPMAEDLLVMPGAVFDRCRNRIGYGKGFYDRFLAAGFAGHTVALAFSVQIVGYGKIPVLDTDVRPDKIVTERFVIAKEDENAKGGCMELTEIGKRAKAAKYETGLLDTDTKNKLLTAIAQALIADADTILAENERDMENGRAAGMHQGLLDRLKLTKDRIAQISEGLMQITKLPDPVGCCLDSFTRPNGMEIKKISVPLGVIGIIYESRPNVTADAFGLCFKAGNAVILKGGSDAIHSNKAITDSIRKTLAANGCNPDMIQLIEATDREVTTQFMKMKEYVDVLIPRGGAGLIRSVVENATIPVIETGTGNCHIYVDKEADIEKAVPIIINAKTQRIGVCNACESLVIHREIRKKLLPSLAKELKERHVEMRADEPVMEIIDGCVPATEEDFGKEYLDYIISMKTVDSVEEAIAHINRYNTGHSESIITENAQTAEKFLREVDAACVYANVSTRFTDGFEFGFGAEIGISTQKLHARGPMGLKELNSYKYTITGNGQIRG